MAAEAMQCPQCGQPYFEGTDFCDGCGQGLSASAYAPLAQSAAERSWYQPRTGAAVAMAPRAAEVGEVTVIDIKMPFLSMVVFMIKWAIAAIPAGIVLAVIGTVLTVLLSGMMGGLAQLVSELL